MKIIALLVFIAVLSDQICAYPTADAEAAKDAAKDASTPALDAVKDKNPLKGISNSTNIIKEGTIFMATVIAAGQNFMKNVIKEFSPGSSVPGLDNFSKMSSILNPTEMMSKGKDVMDTLMKSLSSPLSGPESMLKPHDPPSSDAASKSASKAESKNPLESAMASGSHLMGDLFNFG